MEFWADMWLTRQIPWALAEWLRNPNSHLLFPAYGPFYNWFFLHLLNTLNYHSCKSPTPYIFIAVFAPKRGAPLHLFCVLVPNNTLWLRAVLFGCTIHTYVVLTHIASGAALYNLHLHARLSARTANRLAFVMNRVELNGWMGELSHHCDVYVRWYKCI